MTGGGLQENEEHPVLSSVESNTTDGVLFLEGSKEGEVEMFDHERGGQGEVVQVVVFEQELLGLSSLVVQEGVSQQSPPGSHVL